MTTATRRLRGAARLAATNLGLAARGAITRVPTSDLTDEFGFAPTHSGWNYYNAIASAYERDPGADPLSTEYGRFFTSDAVNTVRDLNDLLDLHGGPPRFADLPRFWLGTFPWGGLPGPEVGTPGPAFGWAHDQATGADTSKLWGAGRTLWYEPRDEFTIRSEWTATTKLYDSIKARYSPVRARGFPTVTILKDAAGRRKAVMVDGHHRLALLAHLGVPKVTVVVEATIDVEDCDSWYYVRTRHCTAGEARRFFEAFFELDGSERFEHVRATWT